MVHSTLNKRWILENFQIICHNLQYSNTIFLEGGGGTLVSFTPKDDTMQNAKMNDGFLGCSIFWEKAQAKNLSWIDISVFSEAPESR